jgi:hypothetical protein
MQKFIAYFEKNYIRQGDSASCFDIKLWNHYDYVKNLHLADNANTNNFVEGWNDGFHLLYSDF